MQGPEAAAGRKGRNSGQDQQDQGVRGLKSHALPSPSRQLTVVGCSVSHSPTFPAWRSQEQEHINKRREKLIMISNNPINIKIKCRPINVTGTGSPGRSLPIPTCYRNGRAAVTYQSDGEKQTRGCFPRALFFFLI